MEDIVIVGGGPGGLAAAVTLAEGGISPILLEKSERFGQKPCGEMMMENLYGVSAYDFLKDREIIERGFDRFLINFYGKEHVLTSASRLRGLIRFPGAWLMTNRGRFEEHLAERARDAGARIYLGKRVNLVERVRDSILINGEIKTRLLIGADGFHSIVREFTGQGAREFAFAIGGHAATAWEYPCLFFDSKKIVPGGYAWIFPQGEVSNVGIFKASNGAKEIKPFFERFTWDFKLKVSDVQGAFIPASLPYTTYFDNLMLVGDSAGLADPLTGAGINSALVSGYLAAKVAETALKENRVDAPFLKKYENLWKGLMYKKLLKCYALKKMFYSYFINHKTATSAVLGCLF